MNTAITAPNEGQAARASLGWGALRMQSDERLQELVREGHEQAFDAIVERYRGQLLRYARQMVGRDRAEDVVQHAFEKALAHLRDDSRELQLQAWLYRVTHNTAINVLERKGSDYEQLDENFDGVPQPPDVTARSQRIRDIFTRINSLPERQRSALMLQAVDGKSHEQIADDMQVTQPVVRQLLYRARGTLRDAVGAAIPIPVLRVWLSGAAPEHAHIGEMVAGAGASAGIAKAGVALLATSVIATGAGVEAARHQHHRSSSNTAPAAGAAPVIDQASQTSVSNLQAGAGGSHGAGHRDTGRTGGEHRSGHDGGGSGGHGGGDSGRGLDGARGGIDDSSDGPGQRGEFGGGSGKSGGHHGQGGSESHGGSGPNGSGEPEGGAENHGGSGGGEPSFDGQSRPDESGSGGSGGDSGGSGSSGGGSGGGGHGGGDDLQPHL